MKLMSADDIIYTILSFFMLSLYLVGWWGFVPEGMGCTQKYPFGTTA